MRPSADWDLFAGPSADLDAPNAELSLDRDASGARSSDSRGANCAVPPFAPSGLESKGDDRLSWARSSFFIRRRADLSSDDRLVLFAALYITARNGSAVPGSLVAFLFLSAFYGFGLASVADTLADHSTPVTYQIQVAGKHVSRGKSTTCYLDLPPWGPIYHPNRISVSSSVYRNTIAGDPVCLELRSGALRAAWYKRVDCANQPEWSPPQ